MKWSKQLSLLAATVALACLGPVALGNGLPDWWGANDGLTSNFTWTFDDPNDPTKPTNPNAPFGDPVWTFGDPGPIWFDPGRLGVAEGTQGSFDLLLKNLANPFNVKHVYFQIDAYLVMNDGDDMIDYLHIRTHPDFRNLKYEILDLGNNWVRHYYTFDFIPQPEWELFQFEFAAKTAPTLIDNLMIGTHCTAVPEPFSLLLTAPALALAFARRRRQ